MVAKVIEVHLPEYDIKSKPKFNELGHKVDEIISRSFPNGRYLFRAIGMQDHPKLSINEFISIIQKLGYDKYDSERRGTRHDEFSRYDFDIQADGFEIKDGKVIPDELFEYKSLFGELAYNFYRCAPIDREDAVRIDLLLIYDENKFVHSKKKEDGRPPIEPGLVKYLYRFKDQKRKSDALLGIIKILR